MSRNFSRTGDPTQLLRLMWRPDTRVGRSGATVGGIVDSAVTVADADGLPALTMRRVAAEIGVGVMTLYGYVPGKTELIELMVDRVAGTTYDGGPLPSELGGWRAGMEHVAACRYDEAVTHGWLTEVPAARPILGPGACRRYELELTPLDGIGLTDHEMDHVRGAISALALRCAGWQVGLERVSRESGRTDDEWWAMHQPVLEEALSGLDLPIASRVGQSMASAGDPPELLSDGLRMLLDGVAARVSRRSA